MKPASHPLPDAFLQRLGAPFFALELFDVLSDTVYFVKDIQGRYVAANHTLAERCGFQDKRDLIGRAATEVFPATLGQRYAAQDEAVLSGGQPVRNALELHLYPDRSQGWCLTWKEPLRDPNGRIVGLVGLSRDIHPLNSNRHDAAALERVLAHVRQHLDQPLRITALSRLAGLSPYQLDRRMKAVFGMPLKALIDRERIEKACELLRSSPNYISQIALECGYTDQAAFTRHFRQTVGLTPTAYRQGI